MSINSLADSLTRQIVSKRAADQVATSTMRAADHVAAAPEAGLGRDVLSVTGAASPSVTLAEKADAPKRVMITYLSTGNGHRTAAQAIYSELLAKHPNWQISRPVDMAELSWFSRVSTKAFDKVVGMGLWPQFYNLADRFSGSSHFSGLRNRLDMLGSGKFVDRVQSEHPDMIVHTNFQGAEIQSAARSLGKIAPDITNVQVVTDMTGYSMYVGSHPDLTLAPSKEVADELVTKGMDPSHIALTGGIPINPIFSQPADRAAAREALGFSSNAKVMLAQGNLIKDPGEYRKLMSNLEAVYPNGVQGQPIEVAVVCGKDQHLYDELTRMAQQYTGNVRLKPLGFMQPADMRNAMSAADLSLTKPGGMTTTESAAMDLPMVLLDVLGGGQETRNAAYFTQKGAGVTAHSFDEAIQQTVRLLSTPSKLDSMRAAASRAINPQAVGQIGQILSAVG